MELAQFIQDLWSLIVAALTLNVNALTTLLSQSNAGLLALGVAVLAGISKLAGDSVALFVNRVTPRRFVVSLLGGGVTFALELALWAISIWFVAAVVFRADEAIKVAWLVVAVASAPWVFGLFVFAPYFGELIRWALRIWSWLIVLVLLRDVFDLTFVAAFVTATVGWLALRALGLVFARPIAALDGWLWTRLTRTPTELTFERQAEKLARRLRES